MTLRCAHCGRLKLPWTGLFCGWCREQFRIAETEKLYMSIETALLIFTGIVIFAISVWLDTRAEEAKKRGPGFF